MSRRQQVLLVATVVALAAAVATAWAVDLASEDSTAYTITVLDRGKKVGAFTLGDLQSLPTRHVVMQGQEQSGPPLMTVLEESGIKTFDRVTITGLGVRDDGVIVLRASEIDQDVLLDIAQRGTTKLCGPRIAWEDRVRDVQRVEVR